MTEHQGRQSEAGFTLIELMVSIILLGMLTIGMYGGVSFGTRVWQREQDATSELGQLRSAQILLHDALSRAYPLIVRSDDRDARADFTGTPTSIAFLIPAPSDVAPGGLARITIGLDANTSSSSLVYRARPELAVADDGVQRPILRRVKALAFSYFGSDESDRPGRWSSVWEGKTHLPAVIKIHITLEGRHNVPREIEFAVRPRVTADAGCSYDPLTKDCRGY